MASRFFKALTRRSQGVRQKERSQETEMADPVSKIEAVPLGLSPRCNEDTAGRHSCISEWTNATWRVLCAACKRTVSSIAEDLKDKHSTAEHHKTAIDCKTAADAGCPICRIVWFRASEGGARNVLGLDVEGSFTRFSVNANKDILGHNGPNGWDDNQRVLSIDIRNIMRAQGMSFFHQLTQGSVLFGVESLSEPPCMMFRRPSGGNTACKEAWAGLQSWIERCEQDGDTRGLSKDPTYSPTRVLDVGEVDQSHIFLHERKDGDNKAPYAALSHCWGGAVSCMLFDDTLEWQKEGGVPLSEARASGIAISSLPLSFVHAIDVTRRLGLRYLWVDCLCIPQNSSEDRKKQAARMGSVYQSSYVTLVASGSANSNGGLHHDRDPLSVQPIIISSPWQEDGKKNGTMLVPKDFWRELVTESFVGRRGWALQERLLSPIKIYFGSTQLAWESGKFRACESFFKGLPVLAQPDRDRDPALDVAIMPDSRHPVDASIYFKWARIVEEYQEKALTFPSDKLPAIHGIARLFQNACQDDYLCGFWAGILPSQLTWTVDNKDHIPLFRADEYKTPHSSPQPRASREGTSAPSWSWASIIGPVFLAMPLQTGILIRLQIHDHMGTDLQTNDIDFHHNMMLVAWGSLHRGVLAWTKNDKWTIVMSRKGCSNEVSPTEKPQHGDQGLDPGPAGSDVDPNLFGIAQPDTDSDVPSSGYEETGYARMKVPVVCLPTIDTGTAGKYANGKPTGYQVEGISGLMVVPVFRSGYYRRVGVFHLLAGQNTKLDLSPPDQAEDLWFKHEDQRVMFLV